MSILELTTKQKAAHAAYMREYMRKNPDKAKAANEARKLKLVNDPAWAEKRRASKRATYLANKGPALARAKKWRLENPERYKENQRRAHTENKEARVAKMKKWRQDNPERAKALACDYIHRRRGRMLSGDVESCSALIAKWKLCATFACKICGKRFKTEGNLNVDHIIPLAKGGPHVPSNLQKTCRPCNLAKSDKIPSSPAITSPLS